MECNRNVMNGYGLGRALAVIALLVIVVGGGIALYNAGIDQGVAQHAAQVAISSGGQTVTVVPAYGYGYGWGHGWGFFPFGFFFWILGFFLILGLLRAAFGRGRGWHGRPGGGWGDRRQMLEDWHRSAHGGEPVPPTTSPPPQA
jgi:hypothetical protein